MNRARSQFFTWFTGSAVTGEEGAVPLAVDSVLAEERKLNEKID